MRFRLPTPVLLGLIALAIAILLALGVWQVRRGEERANLVATRNAQLAGEPLSTAEARTRAVPDPAALDYRLVAIEGTWDGDRVMILANRARYGLKGENVIQPLVIAPGEAVLVDRGWYPVGQRAAVLARLREGGNAGARGVARYIEGLRSNRTPAGTWTGLSPDSMAAGLPYRLLPWYVIEGPLLSERDPMPDSYPAQGFLPYSSDTPHTEYAITWFGIAAALAAVSVMRFVIEPRRARRRTAALKI
ncbi:MAG: SURF1 family protein [Dehalococcoidia bacterium]